MCMAAHCAPKDVGGPRSREVVHTNSTGTTFARAAIRVTGQVMQPQAILFDFVPTSTAQHLRAIFLAFSLTIMSIRKSRQIVMIELKESWQYLSIRDASGNVLRLVYLLIRDGAFVFFTFTRKWHRRKRTAFG